MKDKILMIHEVKEWMLELDLSNFKEITFDDGLYSQYKHIEHFKKFNVPLTFFISTNIILEDEKLQNKEITLDCRSAHQNHFTNNDKSQYMTWNQIKEIHNNENCYIGGHSHNHYSYKLKDLKTLFYDLTIDTELMINTFKQNNIIIDKFCFPYNTELPLYKGLLKKQKITKFYGQERIAIEDLK